MSDEPLTLALPDEMVDRLVDLVATRVLARLDHHGDNDNGHDGWLRGAAAIATYLGCPASRVYSLHSAGRIPVERDGSALVAQRGDLDAWLHNGGGKRP